MTKILKRPLSILLAVLMIAGVFAALPLTVYADHMPKGLDHFIPLLDNVGNVASYDVSINVYDNIPGYQRTVRLLFSPLTIEEIKAKPGWSNISTSTSQNMCYLSGDTNTPSHGLKLLFRMWA